MLLDAAAAAADALWHLHMFLRLWLNLVLMESACL